MAAVTVPSRPVVVADVPDIVNLDAEFVYNFFVPDELVNGLGTLSKKFAALPAESLDAMFASSADVRSRIPRFVRLLFTQVRIGSVNGIPIDKSEQSRSATPGSTGVGSAFGAAGAVSVKKNLSKIVAEEAFSNFWFTGLEFQDTGVDGKLYLLASGSISMRLNGMPPDQQKDKAIKFHLGGLTYSGAAQFLNASTSDGVDGNMILESIGKKDAYGVSHVRSDGKKIVDAAFADVKKTRFRVQLNSLHASKLLKHAVGETSTIFCDEILGMLPGAKIAESAAIAASQGTFVKDEYATKLPFVAARPVRGAAGLPSLSSRIVGYVIEKDEILSDGSVFSHAPLVLEGQDASQTVDFRVKYGAIYAYAARAIAAVEFVAIDKSQPGKLYAATVLVASRPSPTAVVKCVEVSAPPSPADFRVSWDYLAAAPRLTWSMPIVQQRDVRAFQVFKRASIVEPFELVKMYDFNDAAPRIEHPESVDPQLLEKSSGPVTHHIDRLHRADQTAIYAVASVDAHGMVSAYSAQYETKFDRVTNRLRTRLVSVAGAMRQYPNMRLASDAFVDSMRDSGHSRVAIAFAPEFIEARNASGGDLGLIKFAKGGKQSSQGSGRYELRIINVDLQRDATVAVAIFDARGPAMGPPLFVDESEFKP